MLHNINEINPYIRVAMRSVLSSGTEIKKRTIFDYELIYIESGEFTFIYDESSYHCTSGQFIFIRPGISHSFTNINCDLSQPHIHFDMIYSLNSSITPISFKDVPEFTPKEYSLLQEDIFESYPSTPFVTFFDKQSVLKLFYSVVGNASDNKLKQKAELIQIIDMMISANFMNCFTEEKNQNDIACQLKEYIDAGQGLSAQLCELEKQFSYSKYYLERQFKKHWGVSLIAYKNSKRMDLAKKLLYTEKVSDVSEELGFSSVYVFSRAFKQHFGICPSEFINSYNITNLH